MKPIIELLQPKPEDYNRIAESISKISDAAKALRASGLSKDAVIVLIKDATGLPKRDINAVLIAAEDLRRWCLAKP